MNTGHRIPETGPVRENRGNSSLGGIMYLGVALTVLSLAILFRYQLHLTWNDIIEFNTFILASNGPAFLMVFVAGLIVGSAVA